MTGYAYHRTVIQILLFHKADTELVQQRLYDKKTQAEEQYCAANFIYDIHGIFLKLIQADFFFIHSSTPFWKSTTSQVR